MLLSKEILLYHKVENNSVVYKWACKLARYDSG